MQAYVIDSNALIYQLSGKLPTRSRQLLKDLIKENAAYISVITRIEILGWRSHTADSRAIAQEVLQQLREMPLDEAIIQRCIELRQTFSLKLPDAIIAATALQLAMPLMTRNTADFGRVPKLELFNPFEE